LLVTVNNRLILEIEIVHDLSCHPILYRNEKSYKLQNSIISVIFRVRKNPNIPFVRNFMLSTSFELYYDDVTLTS